MTISAKIIADSISASSPRLTTVLTRYPKFIHGELMTHRVFSRNASSSRAIPVERLIKDIMEDPAMPIHWGANQKGMQADKECDALLDFSYPAITGKNFTTKDGWLKARDSAIAYALAFDKAGYHKQIVNRLIEPFCHINVVITSCQWSNFFALRRHKDAQPEMKALADAIYEAMAQSIPLELKPGEWHTPFVLDSERINLRLDHIDIQQRKETYVKLSVARCARTSYMTHDGRKPDTQEDLNLFQRLVSQIPLHASPAEHQATPDHPSVYKGEWSQPQFHGNLPGWVQYRKTLSGECQ